MIFQLIWVDSEFRKFAPAVKARVNYLALGGQPSLVPDELLRYSEGASGRRWTELVTALSNRRSPLEFS